MVQKILPNSNSCPLGPEKLDTLDVIIQSNFIFISLCRHYFISYSKKFLPKRQTIVQPSRSWNSKFSRKSSQLSPTLTTLARTSWSVSKPFMRSLFCVLLRWTKCSRKSVYRVKRSQIYAIIPLKRWIAHIKKKRDWTFRPIWAMNWVWWILQSL